MRGDISFETEIKDLTDRLLALVSERHRCVKLIEYMRVLKRFGISKSAVASLYNSFYTPSLPTLFRLASAAGVDMFDALPGTASDDDPKRVPGESCVLRHSGTLDSSTGVATFTKKPIAIPGVDAVFQRGEIWPLCDGPVLFLHVKGEGFEPRFSDSTFLGFRTPKNDGVDLPDGTPALVETRSTGEREFVALTLVRSGQRTTRLLGTPIAGAGRGAHRQWKWQDVRIKFAVVGEVRYA